MPRTVPLRSGLPYFDLQANLDGITYTLELRWNDRAQAWFMDVLDEQGVELKLAGLKLIIDFPLTAYVTGREPGGMFVVIDTSGRGQDPGLADLGQRVQLVYFTTEELGL